MFFLFVFDLVLKTGKFLETVKGREKIPRWAGAYLKSKVPAWKHRSPGLSHSIIQHAYTEGNWEKSETREYEVQDQGSRDKRSAPSSVKTLSHKVKWNCPWCVHL